MALNHRLHTAPIREHTPTELLGLLADLSDEQAHVRRLAAIRLAAFPEAVSELSSALALETVQSVLDALANSLLAIGTAQVVRELIVLLENKSADVRDTALKVLQALPKRTAEYIPTLLVHANAEVRVMAVTLCGAMPSRRVPKWLAGVVLQDHDLQVVSAAIERLIDFASAEHLETIRGAQARFPEDRHLKQLLRIAEERLQRT